MAHQQRVLAALPEDSGSSLILICFHAIIYTTTNSKLQRKEFTWLTLPHHTSSLRKVRAGAEACTIEEHCLLVCFHGLLNLLSSAAHDHIPLGVAHQSLYTRKRPTGWPTGTLDGGIFSVTVVFSPADPSLCQLDRKLTSTSFQL